MGTIATTYNRINKIKQFLPDQVDSIVMQLATEILQLNKEEQLFKGIDNEGNDLGTYSRYTEEITKGLTGKGYPKREGELFNMYATGKLFDSIDAIFTQNELIFKTDDPNHPFLMQRPQLAKKLFGLTKEHQHKLNYEMILPELRKWVRKTMKS